VSVWRKVRRGRYLYLIGVVGCLVAVFGLREWGLELGMTGLLLMIMLYMAKDILRNNKRCQEVGCQASKQQPGGHPVTGDWT